MAAKKKTAKKKTAKKSANKSATKLQPPSPRSGYQLPAGNHPGNTGGKKGRSGRPPLAFKALCKEILEDEATQAALRLAALNPSLSGYATLLRLLADHGVGVPEETVNVKTESPRERLNDELARIAGTKRKGKPTK